MLFFYIVTVIFFYFAANYYYNDWKYVLFSHEIFGDGKNNQFSCAPPKKETLKEEIIKKISEKKEFQNCSKQEILEMATTLIKELENKRIIAYSAFKKLRIVNPAYKFSGILFLILLAKILFF